MTVYPHAFPIHLLKPGQRVLSLFSAAFLGSQDVRHVHNAGVTECVMVDHDLQKLSEMPYPYQRVHADCFKYIDDQLPIFDGMASYFPFDVVISDHWSTLDEKVHGEYFEKIKAFAPIRILGVCRPYMDSNPVDGDLFHRSNYQGGCYWRVI